MASRSATNLLDVDDEWLDTLFPNGSKDRTHVSLGLIEDLGPVVDLDDIDPVLREISDQVLAETHSSILRSGRLGRAAVQTLSENYQALVQWGFTNFDSSRGTFRSFAENRMRIAVGQLRSSIPGRHLRAEFADQDRRDKAVSDASLLPEFLAHWRKRLARSQRLEPGRWSVPDLDAEEIRERLLVELVEAMLAGGHDVELVAAAGREATYRFLGKRKDRLRKIRKIFEVVDATPFQSELPQTPEDLTLRAEFERLLDELPVDLAALPLSKSLRRWRSVLEEEAQSPRPSITVADVARRAGRNRSSASRAMAGLRDALQRNGRFRRSE